MVQPSSYYFMAVLQDKIKTLEIELDEEKSSVELLNDRITRSRDQVRATHRRDLNTHAKESYQSGDTTALFPEGGSTPLRADAGAFGPTRPGDGQECT